MRPSALSSSGVGKHLRSDNYLDTGCTQTHMHTHTNTDAHTHAYAHKHTHTHTYTYTHQLLLFINRQLYMSTFERCIDFPSKKILRQQYTIMNVADDNY